MAHFPWDGSPNTTNVGRARAPGLWRLCVTSMRDV